MWETSKGNSPPDFRGLPPLLLTVVLLRVLQFLPTIPLLDGGMPPMIVTATNNSKIKRVTKMDINKK